MQKFIAIDGHGGSGKTYFSEQLAERLNAPVLHLDDFGNDYEPFIGIPALCQALRHMNDELIIFEGVGVFDERFNEFKAFRILVDTPQAIRSARASQRDVPTSSRSEEEWHKIYDIWRAVEPKYFTAEMAQTADLIVGTNGNIDIDTVIAKLL